MNARPATIPILMFAWLFVLWSLSEIFYVTSVYAEQTQESPPAESDAGESQVPSGSAQSNAQDPVSVAKAQGLSSLQKGSSNSLRETTHLESAGRSLAKPVNDSKKGGSDTPPKNEETASPKEKTSRGNNALGVQSQQKQFIGATALVTEKKSQLTYRARVDTGATSCSIHSEQIIIEDPADAMKDNIGKSVRILLKNWKDESAWIQAKINRLVKVKTSERAEKRYGVSLLLSHQDTEKEVGVTLNDRSKMVYPLLLGRNFLEGDFVVDVELPNPR